MAPRRGDAYDRRARLAPAGLAAAPVVLLFPQLLETPWLGALVALGGFLGLTAAAQEFVRSRGRRTELRLAARWNGLPTTRALRADRYMDAERKRRRRVVEKISGRRLPSATEQVADPDGSDAAIASAVKVTIEHLRGRDGGESLLQTENTAYGFRRNAYSLKPTALAILLSVSVTTTLAQLGNFAPIAAIVATVPQLALWCYWLIVVRMKWVQEQADIFSDRFFIATEVSSR